MIGGARTREEARPQDALRVLGAHVALRECGKREATHRLREITCQVLREQLERHIAGAADPGVDAQLREQIVDVAEALGIEAQPSW